MGMYDTIYASIEKKILCPACKKGELLEFQTKDLDCSLDRYFEGKDSHTEHKLRPAKRNEQEEIKLSKKKSVYLPLVVPDEKQPYTFHYPVYRQIEAHDICKECDASVKQIFRFDNKGKLKRFGKPKERRNLSEV